MRHENETITHPTAVDQFYFLFFHVHARLDPENYSDNSINYDNFLHTYGTPESTTVIGLNRYPKWEIIPPLHIVDPAL